jgi:hypothetical protein
MRLFFSVDLFIIIPRVYTKYHDYLFFQLVYTLRACGIDIHKTKAISHCSKGDDILICFRLESNGSFSTNEDDNSIIDEYSGIYCVTLQIDF